MTAWSDPEKCNRETALHLKFRKAAAASSSLVGKCVAVEGFWSGRALFERKQDAQLEKTNVIRALHKRRVGLYGKQQVLKIAPKKPQRYLMIGIYGECKNQWPSAMMVMGYCHYTDGPILLLSQTIKSEKPDID